MTASMPAPQGCSLAEGRTELALVYNMLGTMYVLTLLTNGGGLEKPRARRIFKSACDPQTATKAYDISAGFHRGVANRNFELVSGTKVREAIDIFQGSEGSP